MIPIVLRLRKFTLKKQGRSLFGIPLVLLVLLLNLMVAWPKLHEFIHRDADQPGHQCAVTLFAHGQVDSSGVDVALAVADLPPGLLPPAFPSIFCPPVVSLPPGRAPPVSSSCS